MEQNKKKSIWNILLAIPFALLALGQLINLGTSTLGFLKFIFGGVSFKSILTSLFGIGNFGYGLFAGLVFFAAYGWIAFCIFMKKKDILALIGPGALLVMDFLNFFVGFFGNDYKVYSWNFEYGSQMKFNLLTVFPALVNFLLPITMVIILAAYAINGMEKFQGIAKKLWFVPAVAVFLQDVTMWFISIVCMIFRWEWYAGILTYGNLNFQSIVGVGTHIVGFFLLLVAAAAYGIYVCEPFQKKSKEVVAEEVEEEVVEEAVEETVEETVEE